MQRRLLTHLAVAATITAAVPALANAMPYGVKALRPVSGPTPFPAGCPGAAFDSTMIPGQEVEPSITVDHANPRNIVAAWIQDIGPISLRTDLTASSVDGGKTWKRSTIPGLTKCEGGLADGAADPWVGAGADGELYFTGLAAEFTGDSLASTVVTSRSSDRGRTWHSPTALTNPVQGNETPFITGSPTRPNRAYELWAEFATGVIKLSTTHNRGATWSAPVEVDPSIPDAIDLAPRLLVLPNGTLVTIFVRAEFADNLGEVYATRSRDGGKTWTAAKSFASNPIQAFVDDKGDELPQPLVPERGGRPRRNHLRHDRSR